MAPRLRCHQARLYAAESEAIAHLGIVWRRAPQAQEYLDGLVRSPWFAERWEHFVSCRVLRRSSGSRWSAAAPLDQDGPGGRPTAGVIGLAPGSLRQPVLLHELAHLLAPPRSGHGPELAAVHLDLVRAEMGFFAYAAYRRALLARGALG